MIEGLLVMLMVWGAFTVMGAIAVGVIHFLVSIMFWELAPLKIAVPLLRLMAGAAVIPAILAFIFHKPTEGK